VRERRLSNRPSHGRRGENPRELKTQERIGSNRRGKTGRMDARILTQLKPLKASPPRTAAGRQKRGRQTLVSEDQAPAGERHRSLFQARPYGPAAVNFGGERRQPRCSMSLAGAATRLPEAKGVGSGKGSASSGPIQVGEGRAFGRRVEPRILRDDSNTACGERNGRQARGSAVGT
jgi:hypothetical protein